MRRSEAEPHSVEALVREKCCAQSCIGILRRGVRNLCSPPHLLHFLEEIWCPRQDLKDSRFPQETPKYRRCPVPGAFPGGVFTTYSAHSHRAFGRCLVVEIHVVHGCASAEFLSNTLPQFPCNTVADDSGGPWHPRIATIEDQNLCI
jgi:hypothetical protein